MHEYSIVSALLTRVEQEAAPRGAVAVHRVQVRIGELSGVEPELLSSAWELVREGTLCAGAPLEVEKVAARWVCRTCGAEVPRGGPLRCVPCDAPARLLGGDEIVLARIEMEVP